MQYVEMEKALIGAIVRDDSLLGVVAEILTPECFSVASLRTIYQTCLDMAKSGVGVDILTIESFMDTETFVKSGGRAALIAYCNSVPYDTVERIEGYAKEVRRSWEQRAYVEALQRAIALTTEQGLAVAQQALMEETMRIDALTEAGFEHISESVREWMDEFEKGLQDPNHAESRFLKTGNIDYDKRFGGLRKGLNILGGRPGMGKSAYALTEARNIASRGKKVLLVSIEMPAVENVNRLVAALSMVNSSRLESFDVKEEAGEVEDIVKAATDIAQLPIWIASVKKLTQITGAIDKWARHNGGYPDVVFIDYLQLVDDESSAEDSEYRSLSSISKRLMYYFKFTAKCPCRLLCQLSRGVEGRQNKRPILSDIRGSGGIEQDADVIDFLYRDDYYNEDTQDPGTTEVIRAKSRQSAVGTIKVSFDAETVTFRPLPPQII